MEKFRQNLNNANVLFLDVRKSSEIEGGKITAENWLNILHTDVGKEFSLSKEEFEVFKSNSDLVGDRKNTRVNRYRRKRPKVDASFFDSALSHTRRSDASKKEKKIACPLLDVFACEQVSSPRLYQLSYKKF